MKILHVVSNYYPAHGGPQYTMKHLSEKMVDWYKDDVTVATSNSLYGPEQKVFKKIEPVNEIVNGVNVFRFPVIRWHYQAIEFASRVYRKIFKQPLPHRIRKKRWEMDAPLIDKMMNDFNGDVIMATTINYMFSDYPLWRFSKKNPKPFILYGALHLHINWPKDSPIINRARICDCYIANTNYERQRVIAYGVDPNKVVTIGTGIAIEDMHCNPEQVTAFRNQHGIQPTDILIGHIGRLSEGKGAGILLDAFIELYKTNKNIKLLLAGTVTEYVDELKRKIEQENLPVILLTNFSDEEKKILFNALDIFVLASKGESFGVVFLEAWACKKPVIGTDMGAVASLLEEGVDSYLFEAGNALSLSNKLQVLVNDGALRNSFGKAGNIKVQQNYTWPVIVERYRQAYQLGIENFNQSRKGA